MKYLFGFAVVYVLVGYVVLISLTFEDGGIYEDNMELGVAIALTWAIYLAKYIVLGIWYVLTLIYTGVVHAL